jgi:hypothetical protein
MSLLFWIIWRSREVVRAASIRSRPAVSMLAELRRVEADEADALAEGVDRVAVDDVDVGGFDGVSRRGVEARDQRDRHHRPN